MLPDYFNAQPKAKFNKVRLYVTGFGKFGDIIENPTTFLIKALPQILEKHPIKKLELCEARIVTVSCVKVDAMLKDYKQLIEENPPAEDEKIVVVHFGVAEGRGEFCLES